MDIKALTFPGIVSETASPILDIRQGRETAERDAGDQEQIHGETSLITAVGSRLLVQEAGMT